MRIDISVSDCQFIVKENDRKVICIIKHTDSDVIYFINKYLSWIDSYFKEKLFKMMKMSNYFVGVATCSPEDEWDVETGKKIAYYKAKYKYVVSFFKKANAMMNEIDKQLAEIECRFNQYGLKMDENMSTLESQLTDFLTFDSEN